MIIALVGIAHQLMGRSRLNNRQLLSLQQCATARLCKHTKPARHPKTLFAIVRLEGTTSLHSSRWGVTTKSGVVLRRSVRLRMWTNLAQQWITKHMLSIRETRNEAPQRLINRQQRMLKTNKRIEEAAVYSIKKNAHTQAGPWSTRNLRNNKSQRLIWSNKRQMRNWTTYKQCCCKRVRERREEICLIKWKR